jgi:uncharacterized protein (TIGR02453 family)
LPQAPHFSPAALAFLRSLKRNNRREWFNARKHIYEAELKAPMLALIAGINDELADFAPEMMMEPNKAMLRIYRDIRFSANKQPYKTHIAAYFKPSGLYRTSGAGFYLHVSPEEVVVAGGAYMPEREQLLAMRMHIAEHHARLRKILKTSKIRKLMDGLEGDQLTRTPKGFAKDHPAEDLLRHQQWAVSVTLPPKLATSPKLLREITTRFRAAWPLVSFLNEPLASSRISKQKKAAFGL